MAKRESLLRLPFFFFFFSAAVNTFARYTNPPDEQWHNQINAKGYFCVFPPSLHSPSIVPSSRFLIFNQTDARFYGEMNERCAYKWDTMSRDSNGNFSFPFQGPIQDVLLHPFIHYSLDVSLPFSQAYLIFPNCLLPLLLSSSLRHDFHKLSREER